MATLEEVKNNIFKKLDELSKVDQFVAINLHTLTLDRIFTQGLDSDGNSIGTYETSTIARKKRKKRFTSNEVNLRDTEKFVNSYIVKQPRKNWIIGFENIKRKDGTTNRKIRKYLEESTYEKKIFNLTPKEKAEIPNLISDYTKSVF